MIQKILVEIKIPRQKKGGEDKNNGDKEVFHPCHLERLRYWRWEDKSPYQVLYKK